MSLTDILFICVNAEAKKNNTSGTMPAKRGDPPKLKLVSTGQSHQAIAAQALQRAQKDQKTKQPTKITAPQALQGGQKDQQTNQETMEIMAILKDRPTKEMLALLDDQGKPAVVPGRRERKPTNAFRPGAHVVQRLSKVKPQSTQPSPGIEDPIADFSDEDSERRKDDAMLYGPLFSREGLMNGKRKAAPPNFFKPDSQGLQHLPKAKAQPVQPVGEREDSVGDAEGGAEASAKRQKIRFEETDQVRIFHANESLRFSDNKTGDHYSVKGKTQVRKLYDYIFL